MQVFLRFKQFEFVYLSISESFVNQPYALITYKVHTKPLTTVPEINHVEKMKTVTYLRSLMKDIQALQFLPQSPLFKMILSPSVENYLLDSTVPLSNNQLLSAVRTLLNKILIINYYKIPNYNNFCFNFRTI